MGTESMSKARVSAATKQVIVPFHIVVPLMLFALMMTTVVYGSGSPAAAINYEPIGNLTPPCIKNRQENCVSLSPPVKEQQRQFTPLDHCCGDESLTGAESMSKAQVSVARKQVVAFNIFVLLPFVALPTVLCESGSQTTPINYKPISSFSPPCGKSRQENCVTHSPPVNKQQRPCNPSDHCRGGQSLMGTESMSKAEVSAATKQVIVPLHIVVPLMLFALMMTTVLYGSGSPAAAINYEPIGNLTPPCIKNRQENCASLSPPVKEQQRQFTPLDHGGGKSLTGTDCMSTSQISAVT